MTRPPWNDVLAGVAVYLVSAGPVLLGLTLANTPGEFVRGPGPGRGCGPGLLTACFCFDGAYYLSIARAGYGFDPGRPSSVAFFPGFPAASGLLTLLTGLPPEPALIATANLAFAAALVLLSAYLRLRYPDDPPVTRLATLALLGVWPAGFYFRMAYSESLFLVVVVVLLLGFARRWPAWALGLVAGAATGVRAAGVAAAVAVVVHVLGDAGRGPLRKRLLAAAAIAPLCGWGLLAYMAFQYDRFGTPFAFAQTQRHWGDYRPGPGDLGPKWVRLAAGEPIWNTYVPGSPRYWADTDRHGMPALGLAFWNPVLFVAAAAAVAVGWRRGWLVRAEAALGLGLLLIPYLAKADEMSMVSQGRFATVVVPAFVVLGRALGRLPPPAAWAVFAGLTPILAVWTALFAATWPMF